MRTKKYPHFRRTEIMGALELSQENKTPQQETANKQTDEGTGSFDAGGRVSNSPPVFAFYKTLNEQTEEQLRRNHPYLSQVLNRALWQNYRGI